MEYVSDLVDVGQDFFNICMTFLQENYSFELDCGVDYSDLEKIANFPIQTRILYSEGGSTSKKESWPVFLGW